MAHTNRKTFTLWFLPSGERVPANTPGAKKKRQKSKDFYGIWTNEQGKRREIRFKNCQDRQTAQVLLANHLKKLAREAAGLEHPTQVPAVRQHFEEHLAAYSAQLVANSRTKKYYSQIQREVRRAMAGMKLNELEELKPETLRIYLNSLECGARSRDSIRQSLSYLTAWCSNSSVKRLTKDPLEGFERIKGPKVRERRALPVEQLQILIDAARRRPLENHLRLSGGSGAIKTSERYLEKLRMAGWKRALLYKFAILTASRYAAICSLTPESLLLNDARPRALFAARNVKGRRTIEKSLCPELVADLKEWLAVTKCKPGKPIFGKLPNSLHRELNKDLEFAGIPYRDAAGRTFDFHALKKSSITALILAKVDIRLVQEYAEHRDIRTTLEIYNDIRDRSSDEVFKGLPNVH